MADLVATALIDKTHELMAEYNRKWDTRFLELARHIASWSKDPSSKVGAVIVDPSRRVVGTGYNGFPRGVNDDNDRLVHRDTKLMMSVHAEQNAIFSAKQTEGCTIYVYPSFDIPFCCHECARAVIQSGIKRVVGYVPENTERAVRWKASLDTAAIMFKEAGVTVDAV